MTRTWMEFPLTLAGARRIGWVAQQWKTSYLYRSRHTGRVLLAYEAEPDREKDLIAVLGPMSSSDMAEFLAWELNLQPEAPSRKLKAVH